MNKLWKQVDWRRVLALVLALAAIIALLVTSLQADPLDSGLATKTIFTNEGHNHYEDLRLEGNSIIVIDLVSDEVLFDRLPDAQLPIASITKLMTALAASDLLPAEAKIDITQEALATEGSSGLSLGERWNLDALIDHMLVGSSNDGAAAIALATNAPDLSLVDRMNRYAEELGMHQTYFLNETGLDTGKSMAGAYASARDVATLLDTTLKTKPNILMATVAGSITRSAVNSHSLSVNNTNESAGRMVGLLGSKTGYTDLAGGNLAVVFDVGINHPVAVVVLGATVAGRERDVEQLIVATQRRYELLSPAFDVGSLQEQSF